MNTRPIRIAIALGAALLAAAPAHGQEGGPRMATRAELEVLRDSLEQRLAKSGGKATDIERELARVESRLRIGDFRPGDPVNLTVVGQPQWSGGFTVRPDQTLELEGLEPIPLDGVLLVEAETVIRSALAAVLREPIVELRLPLRLAVSGEVGNPGFYDVQEDYLISDVLTMAGGPTQAADLEKIEVRRFGETIRDFKGLAPGGLTVKQLGLQSGDMIMVPDQEDTYRTVRTIATFMGIILSGAAIISLF